MRAAGRRCARQSPDKLAAARDVGEVHGSVPVAPLRAAAESVVEARFPRSTAPFFLNYSALMSSQNV